MTETTHPSNGKSEVRREFERRLIADLRREWNAPKGNAAVVVRFDGPWGIAWAKLRDGIQRPGKVYAVVGASGTGKTQLAVEAMKVFTAQLRRAYYLTVMEFLLRVKATYKKDAVLCEEDIINELRRPSLVVLDEFGKRSDSDWENRLLFHLVNCRQRDGRDTILVSNQEEGNFGAALEPALLARMNREGTLIVCDWPAFR